MTHSLIQEAKPREGYITDHLDAAEGWLDNLEEMLDAYRTRQPTQSDALQAENEQLRHDLERLRVEVKAQYDRGYYDGCTRAALDARGLEIRSKNDD